MLENTFPRKRLFSAHTSARRLTFNYCASTISCHRTHLQLCGFFTILYKSDSSLLFNSLDTSLNSPRCRTAHRDGLARRHGKEVVHDPMQIQGAGRRPLNNPKFRPIVVQLQKFISRLAPRYHIEGPVGHGHGADGGSIAAGRLQFQRAVVGIQDIEHRREQLGIGQGIFGHQNIQCKSSINRSLTASGDYRCMGTELPAVLNLATTAADLDRIGRQRGNLN